MRPPSQRISGSPLANGLQFVCYVRVRGSFKRVDKTGVNRFRFTGRVARKALTSGRYRLTATPKLAGRTGKGATRAFRIVRKK